MKRKKLKSKSFYATRASKTRADYVKESEAAYGVMEFRDRIFLASCEDMKEVPSESIHLTVTSPPYWNAIDYATHTSAPDYNYRHRKSNHTYADYLAFLRRCFTEVFRVHKPGTCVAVVIGTILADKKHIPFPFHFSRVMEEIGFVFYQDIIWHKCTAGIKRAGSVIQKPLPGYYYPNIMTEYILIFKKEGPPLYRVDRKEHNIPPEESKISIDSLFTRDIANNLWNIAPVPPGVVDHPCPFPEEIPYRLITLYSYKGDTVLDPFAGAGTTLKVAKHLDRRYIGYEIEPKYVQTAKQRVWERLNLRKKQIILKYEKIELGEFIAPKNAKQKRYRRGFLTARAN